jgi:hypothetical protein
MGAGQVTYPMHYGPVPADDIKAVLDRIHGYLETASPDRIVDRNTNETITDYSQPHPNAITPPSTFQLVSYEWGVTYAGMLRASETTGDKRFADYTAKRFKLIADIAPMFRAQALAIHRPRPPGNPAGRAAGARAVAVAGGAAIPSALCSRRARSTTPARWPPR